jgi:hypothetical protein
MRHRASGVFLNFTLFWLTLTVVVFAIGHWAAGAICLGITVAGAVGLRYRWRNPLP